MSDDKISIVVPVYNAKSYLKTCVESLINQTYKNTEIILVDDGSSDGSSELCDALSDKNINVISIHQKNSGASAARNSGIEHACGKYIVFCDSDDCINENMLSKLISAGDEYSDSLAVCGIQKRQDNSATDYILDTGEKIKIGKQNFFKIQERQLFNAPVNKLFRLDIIKDNNIRFDNAISLGEDLIFNADYVMAADCDFIVVNEPLYYYNIGVENSLSKKYLCNILKNYVAMKDKFDKLIEFTGTDMAIYSKRYATILLYNIINAIKNTMSDKNNASSKEKISQISDILSAFDVKKIVSQADCSAYNNAYLKLLCVENPTLIYLFRTVKKGSLSIVGESTEKRKRIRNGD